MGLEQFNPFKKRSVAGEKSDQEKEYDRTQRKAGALFAAGVVAVAATDAIQNEQYLKSMVSPSAQEQNMNAQAQDSRKEKGPHGATVTMNERGQPVVNIPASEMSPKPVSIDLAVPVTNIDLQNPIYDATLDQHGNVIKMTKEAPK
jgi:hypothetical protein